MEVPVNNRTCVTAFKRIQNPQFLSHKIDMKGAILWTFFDKKVPFPHIGIFNQLCVKACYFNGLFLQRFFYLRLG